MCPNLKLLIIKILSQELSVPELADVQWAVGNSRGARKLARTPHVNQKKKKLLILKKKINSTR
jgi:hypothetical protein